MGNVIQVSDVVFSAPVPWVASPAEGGSAEDSFSIEASGLGQLTGLAYDVPAHTSGTIKAELQIAALSSADVKNLNDLALSMLDASTQEKVHQHSQTSLSANLSLWTEFFGGGGASASHEETYDKMTSMGLTSDQITKLMDAFLERAKKMSTVRIDFYVNNTANDYSVSGDLYLYTFSGEVKTSKGSQQYRALADSAHAGLQPPAGGGAPSTGKVIKL